MTIEEHVEQFQAKWEAHQKPMLSPEALQLSYEMTKDIHALLRKFVEECCDRLKTERGNIIALEMDNASKPANERDCYIYQQALVFIHVYEIAVEKIRRHFAWLEEK